MDELLPLSRMSSSFRQMLSGAEHRLMTVDRELFEIWLLQTSVNSHSLVILHLFATRSRARM